MKMGRADVRGTGRSTERRNEGEGINLIRSHLAPVHKSVILS